MTDLQTLMSDLERKVCDSVNVKCLVVDEAHKATGNYAYCQVINRLIVDGAVFRVLALSATPGNDIKQVQEVVRNLLIARFELRTEKSLDLQPYLFTRHTQKIVVRLDGDILRLKNLFIQVFDVCRVCSHIYALQGMQSMIDQLYRQHAIATNNVEDYSLFKIRLAAERLSQMNIDVSCIIHYRVELLCAGTNSRPVERCLRSTAKSLSFVRSARTTWHARIASTSQRYSSVHIICSSSADAVTTNHQLRSTIDRVDAFKDIWTYLHEHYDALGNVAKHTSIIDQLLTSSNRVQPPIDERVLNSHPKITHLRDILTAHFQSCTRIYLSFCAELYTGVDFRRNIDTSDRIFVISRQCR